MKHLHFVQSMETLEGGGLGRAVYDINRAINCLHGSCSSYAVSTYSGEKGELENSNNVGYFVRSGPSKIFWSTHLYRQVEFLVDTHDYIHGHGFYVATNLIFGRAALKNRKPLIYHPHGMFEPWILRRSAIKKHIAHLLYENRNFRYAGLWRALTYKEADQIRAQGVTAPIVVCPNGVHLDEFDAVPSIRCANSRKKRRRELLFMARIHPKKGLLDLVAAWSKLPRRLRNNWRMVIAGPDELGHKSEVLGALRSAGLESEWEFIGPVAGEKKLTALASADGFVLPSHSEGFSIAVLEAMACRLPVVITHACNFPEVASSGGGIVVSNNVDALKDGLELLLRADERELKQRGNEARDMIEKEYSWLEIASKLTTACEKI